MPIDRQLSVDLEERWNLAPGWIQQRTGVVQRAIAAPNQAVSDLAVGAGHEALGQFNGLRNPAVGVLLLATSTPDYPLPPSAPVVAHRLELQAAAMDLTVACCGFLYGLILADAIATVQQVSVLLIGANILSRRCDPGDPGTSAIFADGAGAIVVSPCESGAGILATIWNSDGRHCSALTIPDGGSRNPIQPDTFATGRHYMQITDGSSIFKSAVQAMARDGLQVVADAGYTMEDIDWWIPHQANLRIIESSRRMLKIEMHKTLTTIEKYGNSSSATIPITLDEFLRSGTSIKPGDLVLMTAAGAGMTSSAVLVRITGEWIGKR